MLPFEQSSTQSVDCFSQQFERGIPFSQLNSEVYEPKESGMQLHNALVPTTQEKFVPPV